MPLAGCGTLRTGGDACCGLPGLDGALGVAGCCGLPGLEGARGADTAGGEAGAARALSRSIRGALVRVVLTEAIAPLDIDPIDLLAPAAGEGAVLRIVTERLTPPALGAPLPTVIDREPVLLLKVERPEKLVIGLLCEIDGVDGLDTDGRERDGATVGPLARVIRPENPRLMIEPDGLDMAGPDTDGDDLAVWLPGEPPL